MKGGLNGRLTDRQLLDRLSAGDKRVVLAFARANMNLSKAARLAYMSRQGMRYRLDKVRVETGFDSTDFHDLTRLVSAIEQERRDYDRQSYDASGG